MRISLRRKKASDHLRDYKRFLNILVSPHTGERLLEKDGQLVTKSGRTYPIVNGIPILVLHQEKMHITPPVAGKISQTTDTYKVPKRFASAKTVLNLGSGNVKCTDPRVISLDILPCDNVDIVSEAEVLPFASNSFDLVESCAVFEHVYDPLAAIKEARRVLKPGGVLRIDNSFLQAYHGFPSHYFAMTPQANETYLVDDFIMQGSSIPESGTPLMSLSMVIDRFLINLNGKQKKEVLAMSLEKFLELVKSDLTSKSRLMKDFSEYEKRALAATHVVESKKPKDYEKRLATINRDPEKMERWVRLKREYYTLRTEIMLRYHEIFAYKMFALDIDPACSFPKVKFPGSLKKILDPLLLDDPLSFKDLRLKIEGLKRQEKALVETRDRVINIFMECQARAQT